VSPVTVNTTNDTDDVNALSAPDGVCLDSGNKCSLRAAIQEANAAPGSCGTIDINFDPVVFVPGSEIFWSTPPPALQHDVHINGPGVDILTINGGDNRIFTISATYSVSISGLTLSEGLPPDDDPNGGAVANEGGNTTIKDCLLTGNSSDGNGAALYSSGGSLTVITSALEDNDANGNGGGIYNTGGSTLTVNGSKIYFNSASDGGGIFNDAGCTATISNSVVRENIASGNGGGISNLGTLKLVNTFVEENTADQNGGGVHNTTARQSHCAIVNSTIIDNTADDDNTSDGDGGGIFNYVGSVRLMNTIVAFNS
jgi:CSLREA domain-containing protein